jgi:hypothetical protein
MHSLEGTGAIMILAVSWDAYNGDSSIPSSEPSPPNLCLPNSWPAKTPPPNPGLSNPQGQGRCKGDGGLGTTTTGLTGTRKTGEQGDREDEEDEYR